MNERLSDYLRYYLVFSPIEIALPDAEFNALLGARLAEARRYITDERNGRCDAPSVGIADSGTATMHG